MKSPFGYEKNLKGYYTDNNGDLYELKEKVSTGVIFWECELICSKGIVRTERTAFFSNSDIAELRLKRNGERDFEPNKVICD